MATLGQVHELVTTELRERVDALVSAVDDEADFGQVARLADEVGELVDTIAGIYGDLEQALARQPKGERTATPKSRQETSSDDETTKEELLEQARELNVEGRSSMSKEELAEAVESAESVTKEELLDRAREAGVEGRSSMTKDELRKALQEAGT
jgi:hypothetical protein